MEKRNIQQLIKKNPSYAEGYQNIYPWTYTESVKDKETGELLDETLSRMNYFTLAYGGSEYDTRMQVPLKYRKKGTIISYLDYDNLLHVDFYSKDEIDDMSWVSDENWIPVFSYYNGFFTLPWKGSFEDTLLQINKAYRHWGMMITYNDGDNIPVHLKYLENNTDDAVFTNKDNWEGLDRPAFLEWLRQTVANVLGDVHNYPSIMEEFNTWFREELIPVIDSKDATVLSSAKTYTNNQIKALIAGAPETLDTLKEIADLLEQHGEVIETLVTKEAFNTHVNNDSIHLTASDVNTILTNKTDNSVSTTSNNFITNSAITKYVNTSSTNAKNNAVATAKDSLSSWLVSGSDTIIVSTQPEGAGLDVNSDTAMSDNSTNPVQNKIIKGYVDGKVSALDTKTSNADSNLSSRIDALATRVTTNEGSIASNTSNIASNTSDITSIEGDITTINSKINTTNSKVATNTSDISTLKSNVTSLSNTKADKNKINTINNQSMLAGINMVIPIITVDTTLDADSTNAIQNAAVTTRFNATSESISNLQIKADNNETNISNLTNSKQDKLVSGTNIKTVNGNSLLGSGNVSIPVITVDSAISKTSTNPVQNKVISTALDTKQNKLNSSYSLFSFEDSSTTTAIKYGSTLVSSSLITSTQTGGIGLDVSFGNITSDSTKAVMGKTIYTELSKKQDKLVSGTSIKTINNTSILGSGNISIPVITVDSAITSGSTNAVQSGAVYTANQNLANTVNTYHTELNDKITDLYSQLNTKQATLVSGTNIKTINGASILGSGNITIEGGSGTSITVDDTLSDTSENPVQNKIIYNALLKKQDVIDFNNSDVYSSTQPNGVGIHLKASGVTAGTYGPSNNTTGASVTIPKITVDSKGRVTSAGNITFSNINAATATKATKDGNGNVITSTYRTISDSYSISDIKKLFDGNTAFGTRIPSNSDLNTTDYITIGNYYVPYNDNVVTLSNCPTNKAFTMRVKSCREYYELTESDVFLNREIDDIYGRKYVQEVNSTAGQFTYGSWKKLVDSRDTLFKLKDSTNSTSYPLVLGNEILLAKNLVASTQGNGSVGLSINFGSVASGNTYAVSGGSVYTAINDAVSAKQDKLTSSTVIATINGNSLTYGGSLTIDGGGSSISVDSSLSTTSTNPVQNKVVTTNINSVKSDISTINSNINSINTSLSGKTSLNEVKNNINSMVVSGTLTTSTQTEGVGVDLKSGIITAGSYGPTADVTAGNSGASIVVPQITVDTYGRVTNIAHRSLKVDNYVKSINTGTGTIVYTTANGETSIINIPNATTSASGYMSAADKTKLDGIAAGATAVTVDSSLSSTSTNAIQNKAVYAGLSKKQDTIDFANSDVYSSTQTNGVGVHIRMDSAMSSTSTKPVQNKVVKAYVDSTVNSAVSNISGSNYLLVTSSTDIQTIINSTAYVIDIRAEISGSTGIPYTITGKKLIFNGGKLPASDITFKNCEVICPGQHHSNICITGGRIMWSDCTFVTGQVFYNAMTSKPLYYNGGWYTADGNSYAGNPESSF